MCEALSLYKHSFVRTTNSSEMERVSYLKGKWGNVNECPRDTL